MNKIKQPDRSLSRGVLVSRKGAELAKKNPHRLGESGCGTLSILMSKTSLGMGWIPAYSAQAKGRVERSFSTDQDRLIKELRLAK